MMLDAKLTGVCSILNIFGTAYPFGSAPQRRLDYLHTIGVIENRSGSGWRCPLIGMRPWVFGSTLISLWTLTACLIAILEAFIRAIRPFELHGEFT
jgi:hypothetical protein